MINNKETQKILEALSDGGLTITELVKQTKLQRCQVRSSIAFLLGADKISERQIGMAKLYRLK